MTMMVDATVLLPHMKGGDSFIRYDDDDNNDGRDDDGNNDDGDSDDHDNNDNDDNY